MLFILFFLIKYTYDTSPVETDNVSSANIDFSHHYDYWKIKTVFFQKKLGFKVIST